MKITLCGSIAFIDDMVKIGKELEGLGHEVKMPPLELEDDKGNMIPIIEYYRIRKAAEDNDDWVWDAKEKAIRLHFDKVEWADAILVLNIDKNGIDHYIGANTFLEIGLAFHLSKPIYLLNPIPEQDNREELLGMKPIVIDNDLTKIS